MNTDAGNTEAVLVTERAAEWLVRLETAGPKEHAEFRRWLTESPSHVREMLAVAITRHLLKQLFGNGDIDPEAFAA